MDCGDCKYLKEDIITDKCICSKTGEEIIKFFTDCKNYVELRSCSRCKYSLLTVYGTGVTDDIEYHCSLQNNKLIYDDLSPYDISNIKYPECNINKFEME